MAEADDRPSHRHLNSMRAGHAPGPHFISPDDQTAQLRAWKSFMNAARAWQPSMGIAL